jgi:hypothetical protein
MTGIWKVYYKTKLSVKFYRAELISVLLLLFNSTFLPAQDQRIADSLYQVYIQNDMTDSSRFALLQDLCYNEVRDLNKAVL